MEPQTNYTAPNVMGNPGRCGINRRAQRSEPRESTETAQGPKFEHFQRLPES